MKWILVQRVGNSPTSMRVTNFLRYPLICADFPARNLERGDQNFFLELRLIRQKSFNILFRLDFVLIRQSFLPIRAQTFCQLVNTMYLRAASLSLAVNQTRHKHLGNFVFLDQKSRRKSSNKLLDHSADDHIHHPQQELHLLLRVVG